MMHRRLRDRRSNDQCGPAIDLLRSSLGRNSDFFDWRGRLNIVVRNVAGAKARHRRESSLEI